jgi:YlmC/YmxH family sporulation protein
MSKKKGLDFKHKEVINIKNGTRLGYVQDVTADFATGNIKEIIVPGNNKFFNILSSESDITIPWNNIKVIGEDLILVDF